MSLLQQTVRTIKQFFRRFRTKRQAGAPFEKFQECIRYHFHDQSLPALALTHKSYVGSDDKKGLFSNERLEFFGDAVLNFLVTENIYQRYSTYAEGQLSKIKSLVVSRKIIGEVAQSIDLGRFMIMGQSEKKAGIRVRMSIISNAFEAIIGAVYLDGGIDEARKFLGRFLFDRIEQFINDAGNINYKSKVLEISQQDGFGIPAYPLLAEEGPDHAKNFIVGIDIAGIRMGKGAGANKKEAQQQAAYQALNAYTKEIVLSRLKGDDDHELLSH